MNGKMQPMAKKKTTKKKELTKEELVKFSPKDMIKPVQDFLGFGLDTTFDLAAKDGAKVVGKQSSLTQTPKIK